MRRTKNTTIISVVGSTHATEPDIRKGREAMDRDSVTWFQMDKDSASYKRLEKTKQRKQQLGRIRVRTSRAAESAPEVPALAPDTPSIEADATACEKGKEKVVDADVQNSSSDSSVKPGAEAPISTGGLLEDYAARTTSDALRRVIFFETAPVE
mgnify:CR=1 FL=1